MPKVLFPKVSLMLRTSKVTSEGLHPIYIRVSFNGMVERSSGIAVDASHWSKSERKVLRGFPNYRSLNERLSKMVSECEDRLLVQKVDGKGFDIRYILYGDEDVGGGVSSVRSYSSIIDDYIATHQMSDMTVRDWGWVENILKDCFGDFNVDGFDARRLDEYLDGRGVCDGTKRHCFVKVKALGFNCSSVNVKRYKVERRDGYIPSACLSFVRDVALSSVGDIIVGEDGVSSFRYHDEFMERVSDRSWPAWAGIWVYLDYLFQGLAPIDINQIWVRDIEVRKVNGQEYYCWDGKRQKTGVDVKVRIRRNAYTNMLISGIISFSGCERFIPFVPDDVMGAKAQLRSRYMMSRHANNLKVFWRKVNEVICQYNDEHPDVDDIPYIDESLTWYAVRHTFAMTYCSLPNAHPLALATLMGRSPNTLAAYLETLREDSALVNAVDILY